MKIEKNLEIILENSLTNFQKVVGLMNRNKIESESISFKVNADGRTAFLSAKITGQEETLNRLVLQLKHTQDVQDARFEGD